MNKKKGLAVVTGGGSGIGREIAMRLADDGYAVGIIDLSKESLNTVIELITANGGASIGCIADVTKKESIQEALNKFTEEYGDLKVWVSNAGVSSMNHFIDLSEKEWDLNLDVNTKGVFLGGQVAAKRLISQQRGGKIIQTASMAGKQGNVPYLAHYVASKFAVVGLTQAMAHELGQYQITVNAVCPGFVATPMQNRELEWEGNLKGVSVEKVKEDMVNATPLNRLENPKDVAKVVSFLASEDADFITGEAISVNGGAYMD